jgi:hypothetical protein
MASAAREIEGLAELTRLRVARPRDVSHAMLAVLGERSAALPPPPGSALHTGAARLRRYIREERRRRQYGNMARDLADAGFLGR